MTDQAIKLPLSLPLVVAQSVGYGLATGCFILAMMSISPDYIITPLSLLQLVGATLIVAFFIFLFMFIERQSIILRTDNDLTDEEKAKVSLHLAIATLTLAITMPLFLIGGLIMKVVVI